MVTEPATKVCNHPTCVTRIRFARRNGRFLPYVADGVAPFSLHATGAHILIGDQAMTPAEAIEHFRVRAESSEAAAREFVTGYLAHHLHLHADHPEAS